MQLGFATSHHKITCRTKGGHDPRLRELPKIWGFLFNIYTMAEGMEFEFGTQLEFAKAHHKTTLRGQVGVALSRKVPIYLGFPFSISATAALSS